MTSGKRKSTKVGAKMVELSVMRARKLSRLQIMVQTRVNARSAYQNTIKNETKEQNKVFGKKIGKQRCFLVEKR